MSFLSVLKTIGNDALKVTNIASPIANIFMPGAGTVLTSLTGLIMAAENHPSFQATGTGAAKFQWVIDTFVAIFPFIQQFAASRGEIITLDTSKIPDLVNGIVATLNALKAVDFSMKSSSTVVTK